MTALFALSYLNYEITYIFYAMENIKESNIKHITIEEVQKTMKNFVNENVRLINEKWSISDDVQNATEKVLRDIHNSLYNSDCTTVIKKQLYFYQGTVNNYKLFNKTITLNYYVYECINNEICHQVYNEGYHIDGFDEDCSTLNLTLYMVQDHWKELYCEKNVAHELEHILQIGYGEANNEKYERLTNGCYNHASEVIMNQTQYNKFDIMLAKLFYYCNPHEQDAFIQEYAIELKHNLEVLLNNNSELHTILRNLKNYYFQFANNKSLFNNSVNSYRIYGYTYNSMNKMFSKHIQRLEKKMKNVEKNYKGRIKLNWLK